jgi:uncharacterized protein YdeI (YjbR/CyaY-like superfamily)
MTASARNPKVDAHLGKTKKWREELETLRGIILGCGLGEEFKWGKPCYTCHGQNLIMIYGLKESCAIAFFNGALLTDPKGILTAPGPNSQASRWIKFANLQEITRRQAVLKACIKESMAAAKAGLKVEYKKTPEPVPEELQIKLDDNPVFNAAFHKLTPGRQRGYILHFAAAKQSQTRVSRIEKCAPQILKGKGFNER